MQSRIFISTLAVSLLFPGSVLYSGQITSKIKENPDSAVVVGTLVALSSITTAGIAFIYKSHEKYEKVMDNIKQESIKRLDQIVEDQKKKPDLALMAHGKQIKELKEILQGFIELEVENKLETLDLVLKKHKECIGNLENKINEIDLLKKKFEQLDSGIKNIQTYLNEQKVLSVKAVEKLIDDTIEKNMVLLRKQLSTLQDDVMKGTIEKGKSIDLGFELINKQLEEKFAQDVQEIKKEVLNATELAGKSMEIFLEDLKLKISNLESNVKKLEKEIVVEKNNEDSTLVYNQEQQ